MPFFQCNIDYATITNSQHLRIIENADYYVLQNANSSIVINLQKRDAYPVTYCHQLPDGSISLGYGEAARTDEEYFKVVIQANGHLSVQRDMFTVLPVFWGHSGNILAIGNEYETVVHSLPRVTPCIPTILAKLNGGSPSAPDQTLLQEVHLLTERATLLADMGNVTIQYPAQRDWLISADAPTSDPGQFRELFNECLDRFTQTKLRHQKYGFEVSGGLDSSILPLYLAKSSPVQAPFMTMLFPGEYGISQRGKLDTLSSVTGGTLVTTELDVKTDFPLSSFLKHPRPFHHRYELYATPTKRLAQSLREHDITVVCTGIGGDDLCENYTSSELYFAYGKEEKQRRQKRQIPSYLTSKFKTGYVLATPPTSPLPAPLLASSMLGSASNNLYISQGVWPVTPFAEPALYEFCQGLPAYFRFNKNIYRLYCQAYGFPESIYNPHQNEDFLEFFSACFTSGVYNSILDQLVQRSITAKLGYVNLEQLHAVYKAALHDVNKHEHRLFYLIYSWMVIEMSLQSTKNISL